MVILGIESSCDETACAVVRDGTEVLSSVVYTQIKLHQPWGGVVLLIVFLSVWLNDILAYLVGSAIGFAIKASK